MSEYTNPFLVETRLPFVAILGARNGYVQLAASRPQEKYQHLNGQLLRVALDWARRVEVEGAERVYWITLSEMVRHLHIHLYPRWAEDGDRGLPLFEARNDDPQPPWSPRLIKQLHQWARKHDVHIINPAMLSAATRPAKVEPVADLPPTQDPMDEPVAPPEPVASFVATPVLNLPSSAPDPLSQPPATSEPMSWVQSLTFGALTVGNRAVQAEQPPLTVPEPGPSLPAPAEPVAPIGPPEPESPVQPAEPEPLGEPFSSADLHAEQPPLTIPEPGPSLPAPTEPVLPIGPPEPESPVQPAEPQPLESPSDTLLNPTRWTRANLSPASVAQAVETLLLEGEAPSTLAVETVVVELELDEAPVSTEQAILVALPELSADLMNTLADEAQDLQIACETPVDMTSQAQNPDTTDAPAEPLPEPLPPSLVTPNNGLTTQDHSQDEAPASVVPHYAIAPPVMPIALSAHWQSRPKAAQAVYGHAPISYPVWMINHWRHMTLMAQQPDISKDTQPVAQPV